MRRPRLPLTGLRRLLPMVAAALLLPMPPRAAAQTFQKLPARVDLSGEFRRAGLMPRVQGHRDVCSLFAIGAVAEFELARESRQPASSCRKSS